MKNLAHLFLICFFMAQKIISTPMPVTGGGTGNGSILLYSPLCAGLTSVSRLESFASVGSSGQGIVSAGTGVLPAWQNVLPGFASGTFLAVGVTSAPAATPASTVLINSISASLNSNNQYNLSFGSNALGSMGSTVLGTTAIGTNTLQSTTGSTLTAVGVNALQLNTSGSGAVAVGREAYLNSGTISNNVAVGVRAGKALISGTQVAVGHEAFTANVTASGNAGAGYQAGKNINTGTATQNCPVGYQALFSNLAGLNNTAIGYQALYSVTGGSNTGLGSLAGGTGAAALTSGSNNTYIGYQATPISTTESNTIVIGNTSHSTAYFYGIFGRTVASGNAVLVNNAFKLGTTTSSEKYKKNIENIDSQILKKLSDVQVVQFHYENDATEEIQYGMIAEDLELIFPELVAYNQDGTIWTIRYEQFTPLLIAKIQQQNQEIADLEKMLDVIDDKIKKLKKIKAG